jgi:GTP cyclohydrolase I
VHYRVGEEWLHHYRYISPEKYTSTIKQELFVNDHLVTDKILIASNAQNSCAQVEDNQQQLRTSATTALPGSVIVFDDSYEHEVLHQGIEDRFVLLVVLRHPDDQRRWKT